MNISFDININASLLMPQFYRFDEHSIWQYEFLYIYVMPFWPKQQMQIWYHKTNIQE